MKNADADKYDLDGYGIVFDIREGFLLSVLFIHIHIQNSNKICKNGTHKSLDTKLLGISKAQ